MRNQEIVDEIRHVVQLPQIWRPVPYRGPRKEIAAMQSRKRLRAEAERRRKLDLVSEKYFRKVWNRTPDQWPFDAVVGIHHSVIVRFTTYHNDHLRRRPWPG